MAIVLGLLVALAAAVPADGAPRAASFNVEVKGVQTTSWTIDHDDPFGPCGNSSQGSGSERMTFRTVRPVRTTVSSFGRFVTFRFGRSTSFLARAVANRQGTLTLTPHPGECAGGGDGNEPPPPPPDCGRKSASIDLQIMQSFRRRDSILLTNGPLTPLVRYRRCPTAGTGFPDILETTTSGRPIEAPMPARDLFNPALRKHITIGRGTTATNSGGTKSTTSVRWEITFTRR